MIGRVVIAGGGTGGHLFPGMAVVEELRRRYTELEVLFIGTERGIEARVLPPRGERVEFLDVAPLKGRSFGQLFKSLRILPSAVMRSSSILADFRPDLVIGVGGYASGPVLAAASMRGIPCALLEQNAHVGLTNRMLSRMVGRAYLSFPSTAGRFPEKKVRVVGNPVRRDFVRVAKQALTDPEGFEARARRILVMGGSQGSRALNELVPEALATADVAARGYAVIHQTGEAMRDEVQQRYDALGLNANVTPFIDDMARAYAGAALVICRAGATTVAEICAVGRPSVLIPYPHAADDHQTKNAEALQDAGAAVCMPESGASAESLAETVRAFVDSPARRRAMSDAARSLGRPDAAAAIVDDLSAWLGEPPVPAAYEDDEPTEEAGSGGVEARSVPAGPLDGWPATPGPLRGRRAYSPGLRSPRRTWVPVLPAPRRPLVARRPIIE